MTVRRSAGIVLMTALFALCGCGDDDDDQVAGPPDGADQIVLTLENFGDPSPYHFALWALSASATSPIVRFDVSDGAPVTLAGDPIPSLDQEGALGNASKLLITLESDEAAAAPSSNRLIAGAVTGSGAVLTHDDGSGVGVDLSGAAGSFLFDTPTTADSTDCGCGVWWTDGAGAAGLTLPGLTGGWVYEGWVIDRDEGTVYSTGRFTAPTGADLDGAGATSGPDEAYGFPGQDFVVAAGDVPTLSIDDGSFGVKVTLEPEPDLSVTPFFIGLLEKNAGSGNLFLQFEDIPVLSDGLVYEVWGAFQDTMISAGRFLYQNGRIVDTESREELAAFPIGCDLLGASNLLVSIEAEADGDPAPSGSFLLAGPIVEDSVSLSYSDPLALGDSYEQTDTRFILETPSTADTNDYNRGLWFYETAGGTTTATITFPEAADGWHYEAWVVPSFVSGDTISLGSFTSAIGADSDGGGEYAATDSLLPGYPGGDFVEGSVRQLDNGTFALLITIEPDNDIVPDSPFLPIFEDNDINPVARNETQNLGSLSGILPVGNAAIVTSKLLDMNSSGDRLPAARISFGTK